MNRFVEIAAVILAWLPSAALAYPYSFYSASKPVKTVHIRTSSVFCKDRVPVANGKPNTVDTLVSGSTASGCLIYRVDVTTMDDQVYSYHSGGLGVPGGQFSLVDYGQGPLVQCLDSASKIC